MNERRYVTVALNDEEFKQLENIIERSNGFLNKSSFFRMAIETEAYFMEHFFDNRIMNSLIEKYADTERSPEETAKAMFELHKELAKYHIEEAEKLEKELGKKE